MAGVILESLMVFRGAAPEIAGCESLFIKLGFSKAKFVRLLQLHISVLIVLFWLNGNGTLVVS